MHAQGSSPRISGHISARSQPGGCGAILDECAGAIGHCCLTIGRAPVVNNASGDLPISCPHDNGVSRSIVGDSTKTSTFVVASIRLTCLISLATNFGHGQYATRKVFFNHRKFTCDVGTEYVAACILIYGRALNVGVVI